MCDNENTTNPIESSTHLPSSMAISGAPLFDVASTAAAATKSISRPPDVLLEDMASENYWLRQKMKEITADRDRLLCEVANLRLELDMAELKRLPEDRWVP